MFHFKMAVDWRSQYVFNTATSKWSHKLGSQYQFWRCAGADGDHLPKKWRRPWSGGSPESCSQLRVGRSPPPSTATLGPGHTRASGFLEGFSQHYNPLYTCVLYKFSGQKVQLFNGGKLATCVLNFFFLGWPIFFSEAILLLLSFVVKTQQINWGVRLQMTHFWFRFSPVFYSI